MSYDRQIDQVCTHQVIEEALFIQADRHTVRPLRPVAAAHSVKMRFNSLIEVPIVGSFTPAQATGLKAGPFNIQGGLNDQLVLKIDDGPYQTLTLPAGNQISANRVADVLNVSLRGGLFTSTTKRQVRLQSSTKGKAATIFIRGSGSTAASILGFATNRNWRGQTVVPGWSLVNDPNTLADRPTRLIVFDEPVQGFDDYVELDYFTIRQECRRCGGLGIENDWRYDGQGKLINVQNEGLLVQELLKATYTVQGSNPFHTWYGTHIIESIGRKLSANGITQNLIVSDIYEAFRRWQSIKKQQEETVGQFVSDEEYPFRMTGVTLQQSDEDPTIIFVSATIQNRSSKPIQIERGIKTPIPLDLLGSTQQDAIRNQTLPNFNTVE